MNQEQMDIKTPEFVSIQFRLAGLGSRAAALIIDHAILAIVNILVILAVLLIMKGMSGLPFFMQMDSLPIAIAIIVLFVLNGGYFFVMEYFTGGRTIGKKIIGIRAIQENGHSITLLSSFIRNLLRIIDALPVSYLLGILMVFFHSRHKRIGDVVAGTIVIHERKAKRKKKLSPIEKEIIERGLDKNELTLENWALSSFGIKEWKLLSTYAERFNQITAEERQPLTRQLAEIMLPKTGLDLKVTNERETENMLLVLYLNLREEWEFDLQSKS
ncbi:RDD family protein [Neobacillus terrae]|uniref:RDD family protein n=1 Tax=Neobacillus terrae TaxID=3034837 RepID=UPI00140B2C9C|nr:RDD family protein [Neobacillus terrae]NHM34018.1 RDD family protein [Neobacillus terrae]